MIDKADKQALLASPQFRRFLFALIRDGGVLATPAPADPKAMFLEGRRSLVLDVLNALEDGQSAKSPSGLPVLTLIQTLREEGQSAVKEKPIARRRDQYRDLDDGSARSGGDDDE